jgi:hypothetical protein
VGVRVCLYVKVTKIKVCVLNLALRHEDMWESEGTTPRVLNHGTRCR